jgi:hypothetical protein
MLREKLLFVGADSCPDKVDAPWQPTTFDGWFFATELAGFGCSPSGLD